MLGITTGSAIAGNSICRRRAGSAVTSPSIIRLVNTLTPTSMQPVSERTKAHRCSSPWTAHGSLPAAGCIRTTYYRWSSAGLKTQGLTRIRYAVTRFGELALRPIWRTAASWRPPSISPVTPRPLPPNSTIVAIRTSSKKRLSESGFEASLTTNRQAALLPAAAGILREKPARRCAEAFWPGTGLCFFFASLRHVHPKNVADCSLI